MLRRVVKVGGSLFARDNFVADLRQWLQSQGAAGNWLVFGGGERIDRIRDQDAVNPRDSVQVHWQCVESLESTFDDGIAWFPDFASVRTRAEFQRIYELADAPPRNVIVNVRAFYRPADAEQPLPQSWDTTSDAIAGLLATQIDADELVLLKSCEISPTSQLSELAERGIVDPVISGVAKDIPAIRVVRLPSLRD